MAPLKIIPYFYKGVFQKETNNFKGKAWLSAPIELKKHRYRQIHSLLTNTFSVAYFHPTHYLDIKSNDPGENLNFCAYARFGDLTNAIIIAIKAKILARKIPKSNLLNCVICNTPITHYLNMGLRQIWVERAIKNARPKAIFFTTANTYPPARLMSRLAKKYNVPFVQVACRPMYTNTRMEERSIAMDHDEINDARIADYWVVWDKFSCDTLLNQKINRNQIFTVGSKMIDAKKTRLNSDVILLLTHSEALNASFLECWMDYMQSNPVKFAIREHPINRLTSHQLLSLQKLEFENITSIALDDLDLTDKIVISINSTAPIEFISRGSGVVWLNFLSNNKEIFQEITSKIGTVFNTKEKFFLNAPIILNSRIERKIIAEKCNQAYQQYFRCENEIALLINKIENHANT